MVVRQTLLVVCLLSTCATARAQPFAFTKILDSNTSVPDSGGGVFKSDVAFSNLTITDGHLVFRGQGPSSVGAYEWTQESLIRVADRNSPAPGAGGTFTAFGPGFGNDGSHAVFVGRSDSIGGLYHRSGGVLQRVVDTTMSAPNGGAYGLIGIPAVEGASIAFFAGHVVGANAVPAVYRSDNGVITSVADTSTPAPGGNGAFTDFDANNVRLDHGAAWFRGRDADSKSGIYRKDLNGLQAIVNYSTEGPAGMGKFVALVSFNVDGNDIILGGATEIGDPVTGGVFARVNGTFTKIASSNAAAPGGGTYAQFTTLSIADGISVFGAINNNTYGSVYTNLGGQVQRIIGPGDILDGKTVRTTDFARDGNQLAIHVTFTDHLPSSGLYDEAIYLTTLPGPGALLPFGAAALWAAKRSR